MTGNSEPAQLVLSAAALAEWSATVESVLRGVAHALNNRAAALGALMELVREPDDDAGSVLSILSGEMQRSSDLVSAIRNLATPKDALEAIAPDECATDALTVLRLHAGHRDRQITIDAGAAPPIRTQRWMFVRALIALGARAAPDERETRIVLASDGDWLVTRADGPPRAGEPGPYVSEVARAMGGEPLTGERGFRIPTLAALRRREGRGG